VAAASCPCCDEEPPTRAHGELDIVQINCLLYNKLLNPILKGEAQAATQGCRLHIVSPFASPTSSAFNLGMFGVLGINQSAYAPTRIS
jgi:hypothetical protein